jgi:hypothetical protein
MSNHHKSPSEKEEAANQNTSQVRLEELARTSIELARIVAKNSNTSTNLLNELASSSDEITRKGVVSNPNTASDVLFKLGKLFPKQLLDNPIFPLLILENPNLTENIPTATLRSLLKQDEVPYRFISWAGENSKDIEVLLAVAMNPQTQKTTLEKLIQSGNTDVIEAAKLHVNWAGETSEGWEEAALYFMKNTNLPRDTKSEEYLWAIGAISDRFISMLDVKVRLNIAESDDTVLTQLLENADTSIRLALAKNPHTPVHILEQLIGDEDDEIRKTTAYHYNISSDVKQQFEQQLAAVENPRTSANNLRELATSRWMYIRLGVAGHINTPEDALEILSRDEDSLIRTAIALNINTPASALQYLSTDEDPWIRKALACHLNTPVDLLIELAKDDHPDGARKAVALNPNTPVSFLQELAKDDNFCVLESLAKNPNTPLSIIKELAKSVDGTYTGIQANANHNIGMRQRGALSAVYGHGLFSLRSLVSQLPDCRGIPHTMRGAFLGKNLKDIGKSLEMSFEELEQGAYNSDAEIRETIASQPNITPSLLQHLAGDETAVVRRKVASHLNAPISLLEYLADDIDPEVRAMVAANSNTNLEILEKLAADKHLEYETYAPVRIAVASNPKTPPSILKQLVFEPQENFRLVMKLRHAVAKKFNTPVEILLQIAEDVDKEYIDKGYRDWDTLRALAENVNTPANVLESLAEHKYLPIVLAVASNRNTTPAILEKLAEHPQGNVQEAVFYNLEKFSDNSDVLSIILEKLVFSKNSSLSYKIATYPKAPPIILEVLAMGGYSQHVASNPNTPLDLLLKIAQHKNGSICPNAINSLCRKLVEDPHIPADILHNLAAIKDKKLGISIRHLQKLSKLCCG